MNRNTIATTCIAFASVSFASASYAACPSKTIFACTTTKGKAVEVCESPKTVAYSFGKKGANPEMALSVPKSAASKRQMQFVGARSYYSVLIPNGKTVYEVFSSYLDDESHGIDVHVGGKKVATLTCKPDTVTDNMFDVQLKEAPEE